MKIERFSLKIHGEQALTPNFKVKEFRCKDNSDEIFIDTDLIKNQLQNIRNHFAKPINIVSAYRTSTYNKKIGGATNSYHVKGQAIDFNITGITPNEIAKFCEKMNLNGIIQYNNFVHIDSRPTKY